MQASRPNVSCHTRELSKIFTRWGVLPTYSSAPVVAVATCVRRSKEHRCRTSRRRQAGDVKPPLRTTFPDLMDKRANLFFDSFIVRVWSVADSRTPAKTMARLVAIDLVVSPHVFVRLSINRTLHVPLCDGGTHKTNLSKVGHVVLMVNHHNPVGSHTDRVLGMVIVDTATSLQAPGITTQEWFPVRKGPGMAAGDAPQGKVHVKVRVGWVLFLQPLENTASIIM